MAKIRGITVETLPAPSAGLASILSDHHGEGNTRGSSVFGVVEAFRPQSTSFSSSSKLCSLEGADIAANDCDHLEEDVALKVDSNGTANAGEVLSFSKDLAEAADPLVAIDVRKKTKENAAQGDQGIQRPKQKASSGEALRTVGRRRLYKGAAASGTSDNRGRHFRGELRESSPTSQGKLVYHLSSPSRMVPHSTGSTGKDTSRGYLERQSAPVQVPGWSRIIVKTNLKAMIVMDDGDEGEKDDDDNERLPPHEFLAKEYAKNRVIAFSVCEGQGRTLKGRDLSRVRDAVWSQLGFAD